MPCSLRYFTCLFIILLVITGDINAQIITAGPYLQKGSKTAATIRWRTDVPCKSKVTLGTAYGTYPISVTDNTPVIEHILTVTGLTANTKYYYTVETDIAKLQGDTLNFFTTAPTDTFTGKTTIAAFGDCGRNEYGVVQTMTLGAYQNYLNTHNMSAADLMLLLGDNAYDSGKHSEYTANFFGAYQSSILKNHMLFPCPGNHDYGNDPSRQADHNVAYYSIFSVPDSAQCGGVASYNNAYYSFDRGNIHFLSLDSYGQEDAGTTRLYDTSGKQVQWIKADLAANTKKWTIVYWHHPPYTMGSHNSDAEAELVNIRQNFLQILERNGVDLVICGHSHGYERSYLLKGHYGYESTFNKTTHAADTSSARYDGSANSCPYIYPSGKNKHGTVYVVSGSSGAFSYLAQQAGYPHNALPYTVDYNGGMFYLEIEDNRLDAKFIMMDSTIGDRFTIIKDARRKDTMYVLPGNSIDIHASWPGTYIWSTNATTKTINVTPSGTTIYTVKDSAINTCITDEIVVKTGFPPFVTSVDNVIETKLFPIPAKNLLHAEIQHAKPGFYTFTIYNTKGQELHNLTQYLNKGKQDVSIDVQNLPANQILLLKVSNKNAAQTFRFTRD